jgi:hypothetical protein
LPELNYSRIERITIVLALAGALATYALSSIRDAGGFLMGALISLGSLRSWVKIGAMLGQTEKPPGVATALLLAMRYPAIAVAVYVTIKLLGITPAALGVGLLVSFAAILVELVYGQVSSR